MDVVPHCPLTVAGRVWKPRPGASILTFVAKATFVLAPGKLALATEQQPVHELDCPWSDAVQSLYAASDLAPRKLRADVVLIGAAFAPGGAPVPMLTARLTLGEMSKAVDVWCDRTLRADGSVVEGAPFTHMPLLYERAAGGPGTDNPVGMSQQRDAYGAVALPNLTRPGARLGPDVSLAFTGFGPLGARWPGRLTRLGRHADAVSPARWHEQPLPPDLDMGYFNVAPPDQQVGLLSGGEHLALENLHPDHPRLDATLPTLRPRAHAGGPGGDKSVPMRCDTLWIDTSRGICTMTYRGQVLLGSAAEAGSVVVTLGDAEVDVSSAVRPSPTAEDLVGTLAIDESVPAPPPPRRPAATLPFVVTERRGGAREGQAAGGLPFRFPPAERLVSPPSTPPSSSSPAWPSLASPPLASPLAPAPAPFVAEAPPPVAPPPPRILPALPLPPPPPPAKVSAPAGDSRWAFPGGGGSAGTIAPVTAPPAPPAPVPGDFRGGAGALLASNAAAGVNETRPAAASSPAIVPAPSPPPAPELPDAIDLLHLDVESVPRLRRVPAWRRLLAKLDDRPLDADEDDPTAAKDPMAVEDRREILEILARAEVADSLAVHDAVTRALRDDGRFFAPIVLIRGERATPFGEVEALQSTVNTVTPLIGADEALRAAVDAAKERLALPPLASSPAVAEALTGRIREAFAAGKRSLPAGYLEAQTERALLEQRAYQRRTVLGGRRQRGLFHFPQAEQGAAPPGVAPAGAAPMVAYLPDEVAPKLPLFARFKVKIIARVHHALDQYEPGALALEALAVARLIAPPRRS